MTIATALYSSLTAANISSVGSRVYKDLAPPASEYPYITYAGRLSDRPVLTGDTHVLARNHLVQIDLWEKRQEEDAQVYEDLAYFLENLILEDGNNTIFRCRLYDVQRIVEFDDDIIHHAFSVNIYRKV